MARATPGAAEPTARLHLHLADVALFFHRTIAAAHHTVDSHRAEVAAGHAAKGDPHTCGMHFASGNLFRRRVLKEPLSRASAAKKNQAGKPQTCYDGFYIPKAIAGNLLRFS